MPSFQSIPPRYLILGVGCFLTLALLSTYHEAVSTTSLRAASAVKNKVHHAPVSTVGATSNRTLGFQEIIYMSVDGRTDRSDAMLLLAELTDIKVTRISGPRGEDINPKALPKKPGEKLGPGQLGCWRAHANAWYKVVEEEIETALILEDDADWDISLKDELYLLSKALLENGSPLGNEDKYPVTPTEPYGVGWDMLWVGHCLYDNNKGNTPGFIYKDATSPPLASLTDDFHKEMTARGALEDGYRAVSKAYGPTCTTGYAVTRRGAQRLLFLLGVGGPKGPVDWDLADITRDGSVESLIVNPPLMSQWKTGGWQDSEINEITNEPKPLEDGHSTIGDRSARKAMKAWALARDP